MAGRTTRLDGHRLATLVVAEIGWVGGRVMPVGPLQQREQRRHVVVAGGIQDVLVTAGVPGTLLGPLVEGASMHQRPAGASNLLLGDLWGSEVLVTTSRGSGNNLAMAEYAVAGILHFAKGLHRAAVDRNAGEFAFRAYRPLLVQGKTACIVGAGRARASRSSRTPARSMSARIGISGRSMSR